MNNELSKFTQQPIFNYVGNQYFPPSFNRTLQIQAPYYGNNHGNNQLIAKVSEIGFPIPPTSQMIISNSNTFDNTQIAHSRDSTEKHSEKKFTVLNELERVGVNAKIDELESRRKSGHFNDEDRAQLAEYKLIEIRSCFQVVKDEGKKLKMDLEQKKNNLFRVGEQLQSQGSKKRKLEERCEVLELENTQKKRKFDQAESQFQQLSKIFKQKEEDFEITSKKLNESELNNKKLSEVITKQKEEKDNILNSNLELELEKQKIQNCWKEEVSSWAEKLNVEKNANNSLDAQYKETLKKYENLTGSYKETLKKYEELTGSYQEKENEWNQKYDNQELTISDLEDAIEIEKNKYLDLGTRFYHKQQEVVDLNEKLRLEQLEHLTDQELCLKLKEEKKNTTIKIKKQAEKIVNLNKTIRIEKEANQKILSQNEKIKEKEKKFDELLREKKLKEDLVNQEKDKNGVLQNKVDNFSVMIKSLQTNLEEKDKKIDECNIKLKQKISLIENIKNAFNQSDS